MADDFDEIILICMGVDEAVAGSIVPGSVRGEYCMDCATEVWMSPRGRAHWDAHPKTRILCHNCGVLSLEANASIGGEHEIRALPGDGVGERILREHPDLIRRAYGRRDQA